jgi:pilus assembly protein Flp/PilA
MKQAFCQFLKEEGGATSIEYGLLAAGVCVAIIAVVMTLGTQIAAQYTTVDTALE